MNIINSKMLEALKARAEKAKNRKPLTQEEIREKLKNRPLSQRLKEIREKMNKLNNKEE